MSNGKPFNKNSLYLFSLVSGRCGRCFWIFADSGSRAANTNNCCTNSSTHNQTAGCTSSHTTGSPSPSRSCSSTCCSSSGTSTSCSSTCTSTCSSDSRGSATRRASSCTRYGCVTSQYGRNRYKHNSYQKCEYAYCPTTFHRNSSRIVGWILLQRL